MGEKEKCTELLYAEVRARLQVRHGFAIFFCGEVGTKQGKRELNIESLQRNWPQAKALFSRGRGRGKVKEKGLVAGWPCDRPREGEPREWWLVEGGRDWGW